MCKVLRVSSSGFYAWRNRKPSKRSIRHQKLTVEIKASFEASRQTYGAIRICHDLRATGECIGKNTIARLMRKTGLVPKTVHRFRRAYNSKNTKAAPNLLNRKFSVAQANQYWVSDITFIPTKKGFLSLSVFIDLYSRAVVGWSMSNRMKSDLIVDALEMAISKRNPKQPVLVHSDQGVQYSSEQYKQILKKKGMIQSMSRKGNCWDNAVAESFFHSLKTERTSDENYPDHDQAKVSVFDYIECFYNRKRRHSSLNYQAPLQYEQSHK
jgi:transposase InsO family protein